MEETTQKSHHGIVGLVNTGNSCYMNASLQALSNCPPFCRFFIECFPPNETGSLSEAVCSVYRKMWMSERNPGSFNPRLVSTRMRSRAFRGSGQQDAQEFIRCLLSQIHEELAVPVYQNIAVDNSEGGGSSRSTVDQQEDRAGQDRAGLSDEYIRSVDSHSSCSSTGSMTKLMETQSPPSLRTSSTSPVRSKTAKPRSNSLPNSTSYRVTIELDDVANIGTSEGSSSNKKAITRHRSLSLTGSSDSHRQNDDEALISIEIQNNENESKESSPAWSVDDTIVVDLLTGKASLHAKRREATSDNGQIIKEAKDKVKRSIVSEVFEGELESSVECLRCRHKSVTTELFQDLSLPIPSRKEIVSDRQPVADINGSNMKYSPTISAKVCQAWKTVVGWAQDMVTDPPTSLYDCLNVFFDVSHLTDENRYFCEHCNSLQNSKKKVILKRLPEILCIHLKRFRYDSFFTSKINRFIDYPFNGLNMSKYVTQTFDSDYTYKLVSVVTHYGSAGGGHYIAFAKHHETGQWHEFNDSRVTRISEDSVRVNDAYLLFYQRVPVTPITKLKIADIIPPPEVPIPSEDTACISRHWLMLRNLCVKPGPVLQYHYACSHGAILPGQEKYADLLILHIQRAVYLELVQLYGGTTPLQSTKSCEECCNNLAKLIEHRDKEKNEANKVQSDSRSSPENYILSTFWLKKWQKFISCKTLEINPPGPIDNSRLVQTSKNGGLKFCTKSQYRTITQEVWQYLYDIYGGGPHLTTVVPPSLEDDTV